jgi:hypothetical protein
VKTAQIAREMIDREAIRDCLYRYSRGVDRCDDHCLFVGTREPLIAWVLPLLRSMSASQHAISNILIRFHGGDVADVEAYYHGYHRMPHGDGFVDSIQAGRYVDRFEKRDDEWRIARRKVVVDWFREYDDSCDWEAGPAGHAQIKPGGRHPTDYSYTDADFA